MSHTRSQEIQDHRFCSHCQKNRPGADFYGINRNKGPANTTIEFLKTCVSCRVKGQKGKPVTMATIEPLGFTPMNETRRNPRRQTVPAISTEHELPHSAGSSSTGEAIQVHSSPIGKAIASPPTDDEPANKKRKISQGSVNPRNVDVAPTGKSNPASQTIQKTVKSQNENGNAFGRDRGEKAKELIEFAQGLDRLGGLLFSALEELDDEAIDDLQSEIRHDWRVEEMATFVEGYFKGARKRGGGVF